MGQAGSTQLVQPPRRHHYGIATPHELPTHAPKVLPELSPTRLRCTDNGAILHSGGTISGRRPISATLPSSNTQNSNNGHSGVYRSRSASSGEQTPSIQNIELSRSTRYLRERDPLHRSQTHLESHNSGIARPPRKFGSEPNLRHDEEQKKHKHQKQFRKKYRAPPPPVQHTDTRRDSTPESNEKGLRIPPARKLRLFRSRNEGKIHADNPDDNKPSDICNITQNISQSKERRYISPFKDKDKYLKYSENKDMIQSQSSLRKEENILQNPLKRNDLSKSNINSFYDYKSRASKYTDQLNVRNTPQFDKTFRYSERFKKDESVTTILRREKSFDAVLTTERDVQEERKKIIAEQLKSKLDFSKKLYAKPITKSKPSVLSCNNSQDDFQDELKKATNHIKNESVKNKTKEFKSYEVKKKNYKCKMQVHNNKSKVSSPDDNKNRGKNECNVAKVNREKLNLIKMNVAEIPRKSLVEKSKPTKEYKTDYKDRRMADRGQASGKESSPERSPHRKFNVKNETEFINKEKQANPPKQFYFGMIETKENNLNENSKEFPGLGTPIADFADFHLIERKLLGFTEKDNDIDNFINKLQQQDGANNKIVLSESGLSFDAEMEGHVSDESKEIDIHLRPILPKKQLEIPRFSPAAAWRQLAALEAELEALAVDTKIESIQESPAESPTRSDAKSIDKSGDSGISGDNANSDQRLESPPRRQMVNDNATWTPQQDLDGESSSDAGPDFPTVIEIGPCMEMTREQPFSLSLPRDQQFNVEKTKQFQQPFNSLQKLKQSVSGALGAALGSRRFDIENNSIMEPAEQNWFLSKSAPNSLNQPFLFPSTTETEGNNASDDNDVLDQGETRWLGPGVTGWWTGHVMYLPPPAGPCSLQPRTVQPVTLSAQSASLTRMERPVRSKSSGEIELRSHGLATSRDSLNNEMRERERSASPIARAVPAFATSTIDKKTLPKSRGKRFTFQSTVRQLERKRLSEKLSREAELKEQQRKTELEAMRRVEEEFQRKRAREKASIRQQLRLVSGNTSLAPINNAKQRDEPDGAVSSSGSPSLDNIQPMIGKQSTGDDKPRQNGHSEDRSDPMMTSLSRRHIDENRKSTSNTSSEISVAHSSRSKSTTPVRCVVLSEWRDSNNISCRQYRDWGTPHQSIDHPAACYNMPRSPLYLNAHAVGCKETFTGSPRSDNYRLEFARGCRTPAPLVLRSPHSSTSGSELSERQAIRENKLDMATSDENKNTSRLEAEIIPEIVHPIRATLRLAAK